MDAPSPEPVIPRHRVRRVLMTGAGVAALAAIGVWLARVPIATRFVDRELARAGVPARYTVAGLGLRGQRLENVVIGDPARPDLVADWIETETGVGLSGVRLVGVRAGHVRIRARLVDGRVSLGSLDRLLPPPSGKPFALPALRVDGDDVRIALATPAGPVALTIAGEGVLNDGFRGTLAAAAPRIAAAGCVVEGGRAQLRVAIDDARPHLVGPVRAAEVACAGASARDASAAIDTRLSPALDQWQGEAQLGTGPLAASGVRAASAEAAVEFAGDTRWTRGHGELAAIGVTSAQGSARRLAVRGPFAFDAAGASLGEGRAATVAVKGARLGSAWQRRLDAIGAPAATTPITPILARGLAAFRTASDRFDATATGALIVNRDGGEAALQTANLIARSGARLRWSGQGALLWGRDAGIVLDGRLAGGGGGLPSVTAQVRRSEAGAVSGIATMAPYAVGGASLALAPTRFRFDGGSARIDTVATLSGPLLGGRVEGLVLPVAARLADGVWTVEPGCTPVVARRLVVSSLRLDGPRLRLCATGPALVRVAGGSVMGGARLPGFQLAGMLGSSPFALDAVGAQIDLADRSFSAERLATRIGAEGRATALGFATLDGRLADGALAGGFTGGTGRIGSVPLQLSDAAGQWRFASGALGVTGALGVADTADPARFRPMRGTDVALRLADNRITATGSLVEPTTATRVAGVAITHDLSRGTGSADLSVPGLTFGPGFQPDLLTPVTFGVIADVKGTVTGEGRVGWTPDGVTSTGRFSTTGTDLAAPFGPVAGIAGTIAFDDLLSLRSAPGQRITVRSINPGIEVTDGTVDFRTLSGTEVAVAGARWPFAGGTLTLDPTLLDFGAERQRRMTFRVAGAAADRFLQQFDFPNLQATGIFDGVLPMVFDATGGRIENGQLKVRPGGGSLAYVGELTEKDLGVWGNFAFQTLRSLRYRDLGIVMNGPLAGEMVTEVRFAGISQGAGAKSNFLIRRLQRLPIVFNIRIRAPFRGLLDSAQSFYDPRRLIQRNLPALIEEQRRRTQTPIQPPASETRP